MPVLIILLILLAVILVRTFLFTPKEEPVPVSETVDFDREEAIRNLAALIRCRTVSYEDPALEEDEEFEKLISLLPELYPHVLGTCTLQRFPGRGLLFHWKGKNQGQPAVLMAHYDVVPVEEEHWHKPAFDAVIEDNVLWGRGSLDTKVTFNGILTAAENLIRQGFQPEEDVFLAFSGSEEINGSGADNIVQWFSEQGLQLKMVLDEQIL